MLRIKTVNNPQKKPTLFIGNNAYTFRPSYYQSITFNDIKKTIVNQSTKKDIYSIPNYFILL